MGIQIVPISVRFGNEEFLDGVEITHEEFYTRLAECDNYLRLHSQALIHS